MVDESLTVIVREFDVNKDRERVEAVEMSCEVGPNHKLSLFTNMFGDPICRVRHSPSFLMLVYLFTILLPNNLLKLYLIILLLMFIISIGS